MYVKNKSSEETYIADHYVLGKLPQGDYALKHIVVGEETSYCSRVPKPAASVLNTSFLRLYKAGAAPQQAKLLFGGPLSTYEEWKAKNPTSDFAKATLHAHSLFFVPGSQVRQDLGLVVNNPTGTEIFTSLDPWRPYKFAGFTLNIDVYDLDVGDIRMSVTGTLAN